MISLRWLIIGTLTLIVFVVGYTIANQFPPPTIRIAPPYNEGAHTRTPTAAEREVQVMTLTNPTKGEPVLFLPSPPPSPRATTEITVPLPADTLAPVQGVDYVRTTYPQVQSRPGWGVASEQHYTITRQWVKNGYGGFYDSYGQYGPMYMTLPDGQLIRARLGVGSGGDGWAILP